MSQRKSHADTLSGDLFDSLPPAPQLTVPALLLELQSWTEAGWLRRLDLAFARFMAELDPSAAPELILASALVAHMEGRGHSCLVLADLLTEPHTLLNWPSDGLTALLQTLRQLASSTHDWLHALRASAVVTASAALDAMPPLVLLDGRLYLRRYFDYEQRVASQILARVGGADETADAATLRPLLDRLFGQSDTQDWQKIACALAARGRFSVITGGPGTGKTYTVARLLALLFANAAQQGAADRLRIALAAPTGKAAARLKQSIDKALAGLQQQLPGLALTELATRMGAARTLHALLGARPDTRKLQHHAGNPLDIDVLIVDEASMIHLEMMAALLDALQPHTTLILLGDKDQLASVEAGAVLGDLCREAEAAAYTPQTMQWIAAATGQQLDVQWQGHGSALAQHTAMLRVSRRFSGPIGELARAVNAGDASGALHILQAPNEGEIGWTNHARPTAVVNLALQGRDGAPGGYRSYLDVLNAGPTAHASHDEWARQILTAFDRMRVLCALRDGEWGVSGLNGAIEGALVERGWLRKRGEWYAGRPVMITRNDYATGVFNGDIGIALPAPGRNEALRVYFLEGDLVRSVLASRLADVETAFAMTVHKSQGSEFEHTVLALPDEGSQILTRELIYTGITRARLHFTLVSADARVFSAAVTHRTRRASGLEQALQRPH
ncbi:exodeoxyribonuclease V subunit alpha [Amantichitinum ursilacus]|uniref:RecBCD enzyme subunit RecD n=1 Tax=Amantichitinum ursilacus TaxID=857265 RepID=A0A0N0GLW0_9NEIS|nr:exodeoxyribonuclease V subunit alpha [Amantichitinum ursilacus]KPC50291.1 RecBCD enzyme subunit RecD [Amantichitinum ursilacus]